MVILMHYGFMQLALCILKCRVTTKGLSGGKQLLGAFLVRHRSLQWEPFPATKASCLHFFLLAHCRLESLLCGFLQALCSRLSSGSIVSEIT